MVKSGKVAETRLPSDTLRLIYYYDPTECYECAVVHAYDMCNLFDHHDGFEIIPLFSPPEEKKEHVIALLQKANYDFPIYISIDNAWIKKSNIPKDEAFNVFLIDKEGFPIFVGDPARSGRAWESLNKIISSRSECSL